MIPTPRLACEQCKRRKIRCNKGSPCSACTNANLHCHTVQRARLPRGKSGRARSKQNKVLEDRVARIEDLLAQQNGLRDESCSTSSSNHISVPTKDSTTESGIVTSLLQPVAGTTNFVAPDFWTALSHEVYGLREILEDSGDEVEEEDPGNSVPDQASATLGTGAILFQQHHHNNKRPTPSISLEMRTKLLRIYRTRVDSVYKILHWPTVLLMVEASHASLSQNSPVLSVKILENSIHFMALCSITDVEAEEIGFGDRLDMLKLYRSVMEGLFAESSLLQNPDLIVLQAFVIYLIGLRTCLSGAYTWMLVAVAIRAATALRLGEETVETHTPFDMELRRRLLFAIGILDTHSALDRGTIPILPSTVFTTPPLNINDQDMSPPNNVPSASSLRPTDMSHTAMIYEAMLCQRKLFELSESAQHAWEHWQKKVELVESFGKYVQGANYSVDDSASPIEQLQKISGHKIYVSLQLLLRRPPYRQPHNSVPPWDNFNILSAATNVLEQHLQPYTPDLKPWAWKNWVQWHALAVVLAELTLYPKGPAFDRAYSIATKSFHHYSKIVADSESGMLWKPIAKLMHRVQYVRQRSMNSEVINDPSSILGRLDYNTEATERRTIQEADMFDFMDWNLVNDGSDFSASNGSQIYVQDDTSDLDLNMPWLAWDTFLQDIILPDT